VRIYVASSWRNEHQQGVVEALRKAGHEVYDFKNPAPGEHGFGWREIAPGWESWTTAQYREALRHPIARHGFQRDEEALVNADACVLVLPCGRSAHLEFGVAIGAGKRGFVYVPERIEPELMYLLAGDDPIVETLDELLEAVAEHQAQIDDARNVSCG
jgi:hypothetical protein